MSRGWVVGAVGAVVVAVMAVPLALDYRATGQQAALLRERVEADSVALVGLRAANDSLRGAADSAQHRLNLAVADLIVARRETAAASARLQARIGTLQRNLRARLDPETLPAFDSLVVVFEDRVETCENAVMAERRTLEECQRTAASLRDLSTGLTNERDAALGLADTRGDEAEFWRVEARRRGSFFGDLADTGKKTGIGAGIGVLGCLLLGG